MKKANVVAIALAMTAALGIGGVAAYLTDTETVTNKLNFGKLDIEETEPGWDEPEVVTPNMTIAKDPTVLNVDSVEAYVFQTVSVPVANVVVANEDGTKLPAADTELASYQINEGWVELGMREIKSETPGNEDKVIAHEYLYAWGTDAAMTAVAPETGTTAALFDEIKVANIIEGSVDNEGVSLENATKDIVVNAYGIQTSDLNGDKTAPADVWAVYANQNDLSGITYAPVN